MNKQTFNQKNKEHKIFRLENAFIVSCLKTGGKYNLNLNKNKCLCCGEVLK
jgi:hypothetical protein